MAILNECHTPEYLAKLTAWIADHPDMLERINPNGTPVTGERWTEYRTRGQM